VRKGGQVLPERVEEDLPKLVEALAKRGRSIQIITTDIRSASQPLTRKVLQAARALGIRHYRLTFLYYSPDKSMADQLNELRAELKDLTVLNRELGMVAGFQNHSGGNSIGAPVWDEYEVIKDLDREAIGSFFDIGHATVEGGYAWKLHARLMEPYLKAVYVKDFKWQKPAVSGKDWTAQWCPLGEGMISKSFFDWLKKTSFKGCISQHHEYELGLGKERLKAIKKDAQVLRQWLDQS
jgi:sugar phosphate isomerase/epimerase